MIRKLLFLPGLLVLVFSSPLLAAEETRSYVNARFGTCAEIPASFDLVSESENGDGASFAQSGLAGEIRIYGSFNAVAGDLGGYRDFLLDVYEQEDTDITYMPKGEGWFVLSGVTSAGDIVYLRVEADPDQGPEILHHIWFAYPVALKATWNAIVARYAKTLNGECR